GKRSFLESQKIPIKDIQLQAGETSVHVAVGGAYAGHVTFSDHVRSESKQVIQALRSLGISNTLMLTGDAKGTAHRIAQAVGITRVEAECLPVDKVNAVRNITTRPVLMVGDGVNDAPVLAVADVGMAMGARGSTAASETADVVVLVDDISKAAQAISIAKRTIAIALQSIWVGIAISVGLMLVAATGVIPAVVGAVLQEVVDVVVIFNALRAHGPWGLAGE
ncbi:MAG TPA: HAD-IC family P-type ATPase, partial [Candidatus Saccharimonadales bacterium]|nr:HAD-IC family P-type ATPase [Candidatus Saccharimonadales bacterium]